MPVLGVLLLCLALLSGGTARAHVASGERSTSLLLNWSGDLLVLSGLALCAALYLIGSSRLRRRLRAGVPQQRRRMLFFLAGWLLLGLALLSPLDHLGTELFAAHMVQHELLLLAAAPLLVLASPGAELAWSLPRPRRRWTLGLLRPLRLLAQEASRPLPAWTINAAVLWVWHVPVLFQDALQNEGLHALQHLSFLLAGLLYWRSLLQGEPAVGVCLLSLFTTALHQSGLAALLTFAPRPWYGHYEASVPAWNLTALEDQQLGGLIMWVPGGLVHLLAAVWLLALWLERDAPQDRREVTRQWPS